MYYRFSLILMFFFQYEKIAFDFNWLKKEIHKRKKTQPSWNMQVRFFFGIVMKLFICRVSEFPIESLNAGG